MNQPVAVGRWPKPFRREMVLLCVLCATFAIFAVKGFDGSERPGFVEVVSPK